MKNYFILFIIGNLLFIFHIPDSGYDKYFLISWSKYIMDHGFYAIYQNPEVNNHPIPLYILKLFTLLFHSSSEINLITINYTKAFYILFDFLTLGLVVYWLNKQKMNIHYVWLLIINPVFWYNTVIWIQCDTVHTFFIFAALYLALNNRKHLSAVAMALALATKLQSVIFLPFIFALFLPLPLKKIILIIASFVGTLLVIMFPFIINGTFIESFSAILSRSIDFYPYTSVTAYNFWCLLFDSPNTMSDIGIFFGLSYKLWGLIIFGSLLSILFYKYWTSLKIKVLLNKYRDCFTSFAMTRKMIVIAREERPKQSENLYQINNDLSSHSFIFLVFSLVAIIFFYFNTQMHERYIHPAILFSGLYAVFSRKYWIYILVSLGYFLNLESVMQILPYFNQSFAQYVYQTFFFKPVFISILIFAATILGFIGVYQCKK